jgi:CPA1 family monovalent cation:H+ antiporter
VVTYAATRLKIPPAIPLVMTGVILALIPGLPPVTLAPDLVLLLVLPPVIYSAAVAMSWREFRFSLRPIVLLAVGCVIFTTIGVAALCHYVLDMSWPLGFTLGAIVSPPDALAPLSIARRLQVPRRLLVILEGEGIANDATALVLYRFAVAAVSAGTFSLGHAAGTFAVIVVGEIAWGLAVGWLMLRIRRWVDEPQIEIMLSIVTPFLAYWPPQALGGSGVLATVACGLYISWNGLRLISAPTRLQGIFFWSFVIYVVEGIVFLITGLQARALIGGLSGLTIDDLLYDAALVSAVVIATRFIWMFPATYLPRWLIPAVRKADPSPPWTFPFALAFTGVRGIVSLAAALAIPFVTADGAPFPERNLILFLTFAVIIVTLVGQGLLLPSVIRALGLANTGMRERTDDKNEELEARRLAISGTIEHLEKLIAKRTLPAEIAGPLRDHHRGRLRDVAQRRDGDAAHEAAIELNDEIELLLLEAERNRVNDLYRDNKLRDQGRRRIERDLDLRQARIVNLKDEE